MDVESGRLLTALRMAELRESGQMSDGERKNIEPVPKELERAAMMKLAGKQEAQVSLTSGGKLSKWAAKKRKERRKMAKESRRGNR